MLIGAVLIQQPQGQGGLAAPKPAQSLFGSAGSKDVMYRSTQLLIAGFFALAFVITLIDFQHQQSAQKIILPDSVLSELSAGVPAVETSPAD